MMKLIRQFMFLASLLAATAAGAAGTATPDVPADQLEGKKTATVGVQGGDAAASVTTASKQYTLVQRSGGAVECKTYGLKYDKFIPSGQRGAYYEMTFCVKCDNSNAEPAEIDRLTMNLLPEDPTITEMDILKMGRAASWDSFDTTYQAVAGMSKEAKSFTVPRFTIQPAKSHVYCALASLPGGSDGVALEDPWTPPDEPADRRDAQQPAGRQDAGGQAQGRALN